MALEQQIQKDIMEAMKAHNTVRTNAVRAIKSEILLAKTSGAGAEITDGDVIKLIQKLIKQRKESAAMYAQGGRQDLADNELAEAAEMEGYLPKQLSEAEVEEIVKGIIAETGASSMADMGKVMGLATKKLAGQADGRTVSTIVKKLLA
ncbi:gatB/Yqey domain protein [Bacteroides sp. CAG:770]|uniref:GatB/YqeY domain-containing protein n=1 Tax=Candidatus Cryptobacteroides bacterium TaxID=3085639 RepID=UPI000340177F|nr:GatB/YqeY domain-containing protein [Bacteroidales bacterium]CDC64671.1 gatB/Yqey domain protein [Bacteroides sp. CAG:770]